MGAKTKLLLLFVNVAFIVLMEVYITVFQTVAVNAAIALQTWGKDYQPDVLWAVSEALGPEPRVLTFVVICLFASDGPEARRLFTLRFLAQYVRWILGIGLQEPRPSWIDSRVEMLHCPTSFGLPSGHVLLSIVVIVPLLLRPQGRTVSKFAFLLWFSSLCVGRVYLGTHSTHDLFLGAVLGLSLVNVLDENTTETLAKAFASAKLNGFMVIGFLLVGIANSLLWAIFFRWQANSENYPEWEQRAIKNHCSSLNLFSAREGASAVMGYCGLLMAIYSNKLDLASEKMRLLAISIFIFTKYFIDVAWLAESVLLSGIMYAIATFLVFDTVNGRSSYPKAGLDADAEYGSISRT